MYPETTVNVKRLPLSINFEDDSFTFVVKEALLSPIVSDLTNYANEVQNQDVDYLVLEIQALKKEQTSSVLQPNLGANLSIIADLVEYLPIYVNETDIDSDQPKSVYPIFQIPKSAKSMNLSLEQYAISQAEVIDFQSQSAQDLVGVIIVDKGFRTQYE